MEKLSDWKPLLDFKFKKCTDTVRFHACFFLWGTCEGCVAGLSVFPGCAGFHCFVGCSFSYCNISESRMSYTCCWPDGRWDVLSQAEHQTQH